MRIGAKLYHIRTGSGAGARHLFAGEFRKRAGNCSSALENRGAMNENRTCGTAAASNAERITQCAFLPEPRSETFMDHDEHEENEQKLFSLKEAERARRELEPVLIEAMENRGKVAELAA